MDKIFVSGTTIQNITCLEVNILSYLLAFVLRKWNRDKLEKDVVRK